MISSKTCKKAARTAGAQRLRPGLSGDHKRQRPQSAVQLFPDRLRRPQHHHQGWQTAPRRPPCEGSRDHGSRIRGARLQRGLCAAERAQLERRRRQQRLSRQDHRHGPRRHHLDRGCGVVAGEKRGLRRDRHDGPAAQQRRKAGAELCRRCLRRDPEGRQERRGRQGAIKYLVQPQVINERLKTGLGRSIPSMPSIVKNDHWWFDDPHRAAYTTQGLLSPTLPQYWAFNPAYAQVSNEHTWSQGWLDIIQNGMTPQAAAEKAFRRVEEIFAK